MQYNYNNYNNNMFVDHCLHFIFYENSTLASTVVSGIHGAH